MQRNLKSGICFRYNQFYRRSVTLFIKSLWLKNNAVIIDDSYCSQRFIDSILKDLEISYSTNDRLNWTIIAINFTQDNNSMLFEKLYQLRTISVNLIVMLAPFEYFNKIFKVVSKFNLLNSPNAWLIPEYEDGVIPLQNFFRRIIYFRSSKNFDSTFYSHTNLSLQTFLNSYEEYIFNSEK